MAVRKDSNGTPILDLFFNVVTGEIPEYKYEHKFGLNESIGTDHQTLWTGSNSYYVYPASPAQMKVSSTDSFDHCNSGQGAFTVTISGLDSAWNLVSEVVSLTGQDAVTTSEYFARVHRVLVNTAGTSLTNLGEIWVGTGAVTAGKPAIQHSHVMSLKGQSLQCVYTIPESYEGCLVQLNGSVSSGKTVEFELYGRPFGGVFNIKEHHNLFETPLDRTYKIPYCFTAKTDVEIRCKSSASGTDTSAVFDIILYPK